MNPLGLEAQVRGFEAEERVRSFAAALGCKVEYSVQNDYAGKTDLLIDGIAFQISVQPKSKRSQEKLADRGVYNLAAGKHISDDLLLERMCEIFGKINSNYLTEQ
jgi:hypothetical protein